MANSPAWRDAIVLTRDEVRGGARGVVSRARHDRSLQRLCVGASIPTEIWEGLDADDRFRARVYAEVLRIPTDAPLTHLSAAAMWGLPSIEAWPSRAETSVPVDSVLRSRTGMLRHRVGRTEAVARLAGIPVSALPQALSQVAATAPFDVAVAMLDAALAGRGRAIDGRPTRVARRELNDAIAGLSHSRARRRAQAAADFADSRSGSPGESLSRCRIRQLGLTPPELQHPFADDRGPIGVVDFWWPERGIVGEFDGVAKYVRAEYTGGRPVHEVVLAEKRRESRLRDRCDRVIRWGWAEATNIRAMERLLATALR